MNTRIRKILFTGVLNFSLLTMGTNSALADYYPRGIQQNVSEETLINNGWKLFYEQTYGTGISSTGEELISTSRYTIFTGKIAGTNILPILAAAPTTQIFSETIRNIPQLLNGSYWYFTKNINGEIGSIGFSPSDLVIQEEADIEDGDSRDLRLSWNLGTNIGGYRLGFNDLNNSISFLKQIWVWNGPQLKPLVAPELNQRQTKNLSFGNSYFGTDTLSDPDGELRKLVDAISKDFGELLPK